MRRVELPEALRVAPFSVRDADSAGMTRSRLRARDLRRPFRGVRVEASAPDGVVERARALSTILSERHYFSHDTAARVWGFRMPRAACADVHVTAILPSHAPRMVGVIGHHVVDEPRLAIVDGVLVSDACATWVSLASELPVEDLVVVGDGIVRRRSPLAALDDLRRSAESASGARGVVRLRAALRMVREGTDSAAETRLRMLLVAAGLPEPRVNAPILLRSGRTTHGDLVYPRQQVLVEYDGRHHATDPRQFAIDVLRLEALSDSGWRVIRVLASHLGSPDAVVGRVESALRAARSAPSAPRDRSRR